MNILHVVDMISQKRGGGSARVPWYLAKEQVRLGHNVTIYSSTDRASMDDTPPGVELRLFKCFLNFMGGLRITPTMLIANFRQFDIIHLHNYRTVPNLIAATRGVPFVLQAHGSCLPIPAGKHIGLWKQANDLIWRNVLIKHASRLVACNDYEIEQYIAEGAQREQCVLTDLGIDTGEYENVPVKHPSPFKTILYLGKFHELKAPDMLVRAFSHLHIPDIRLVMAGWDDGFEVETQRLVHELGLDDRVDFLGFIDGRDKLQAYVNADVYVLPSRYEAFGLCTLEACACGTPVIMTENCAISDRLPIYCGQVVPFNEYDLAGALIAALHGGEHRDNRAARIQWAHGFGWDRIAGEMVELYEQVLVR